MTNMMLLLFLVVMFQSGQATFQFEGEVKARDPFQKNFGRFTFLLRGPDPQNVWGIAVRDFHLNPYDISPPATINPSQQSQDFIFSPELGTTIDRYRDLTEEEVHRIGAFGKGTVQILERRPDKSIKFRVSLSWNPEFPPGIEEREERWLGLLRIPEIWGSLDDLDAPMKTVPVYAEARSNADRIGTLENSERPFVSGGRPFAGQAQFHPADTAYVPQDVPSHRISYEEPAAIVLERNGTWFRIDLKSGSGWIERPGTISFETYEQLMKEIHGHLTEDWNGRLWREPGRDQFEPSPEWRTAAGANVPAEVLEWREVGGEAWIKVRLKTYYLCTPTLPDSTPPAEGWLPAYWPSGRVSVWYEMSSAC